MDQAQRPKRVGQTGGLIHIFGLFRKDKGGMSCWVDAGNYWAIFFYIELREMGHCETALTVTQTNESSKF